MAFAGKTYNCRIEFSRIEVSRIEVSRIEVYGINSKRGMYLGLGGAVWHVAIEVRMVSVVG